MRLALAIEAAGGAVDGTIEIVGIDEGAVGEMVLLEIAPAVLDRVQFGRILGQPFCGQPRACGQGLCRQVALVDRAIVEHRNERFGSARGAVSSPEVVEQGNEVG